MAFSATEMKYDSAKNGTIGDHGQFDSNADADPADGFNAKDDEAWGIATEFYPHVKIGFKRLVKISSSLGIAYRIRLMETKDFGSAPKLEAELLNEFLQRNFGKSSRVQALAQWCLQNGYRDIATELKKIVTSLGPSADGDLILDRMKKKYGPSLGYGPSELDDIIRASLPTRAPKKSDIAGKSTGWSTFFNITLLIWLGGKGLYQFSRSYRSGGYSAFDAEVDNLMIVTDVAGIAAIAIALVWLVKKVWGKPGKLN